MHGGAKMDEGYTIGKSDTGETTICLKADSVDEMLSKLRSILRNKDHEYYEEFAQIEQVISQKRDEAKEWFEANQ